MNRDEFIKQLEAAHALKPVFTEKKIAENCVDALFQFLFLARKSGAELPAGLDELQRTLRAVLEGCVNDSNETSRIAKTFFEELPRLYSRLLEDAETVLAFDPAASSMDEIFLSYPGFFAVAVYRFAHRLYQLQVPLLPRLWTEFAHSRTGIDIHPAAQIGSRFFIDHGTGVVIGETAVIGDKVRLYQGVTLGAISVAKEKAGVKRHPTVGRNVVIYSGATLLGDISIGNNCVIGGNVWLTSDVPANCIAYHQTKIVVRDNNRVPDGLDFVI